MKENRESFWRRHQEGDKEGPSYLPYQGLIYFYQTNSHNTHLKLTRLVPAIKSSYQTHSHSIHFKMTGFRRFLKTLKKEKHVLKQDTLLYWLKTKQYKKKVCPFLFLEILRPLSPPQGTQTSYQPTKELALFYTHTHTHTHTHSQASVCTGCASMDSINWGSKTFEKSRIPEFQKAELEFVSHQLFT